jgi:signal transduction histidine kinase
MEDAANSLRLALEREEAGHAHQEAAALRRSQELQRGFLSRLSHELRTPLTAIRGYASSLLQPDVTWDGDSQQRFLDRIAAESARLGRLVDDLLDFSAIESGLMRLQRDWCDIRLVLEAAIACLPRDNAASVSLTCDASLPVVWADHDRLEQVFVNLLNNAFGHNPPGTQVQVTVAAGPAEMAVSVLDDGQGMLPELAAAPFEPARRPRATTTTTMTATTQTTVATTSNGASHGTSDGASHGTSNGASHGTSNESSNGRASSSKSAGAGLGLSIAKGIVQAHGGRLELTALPKGTCFSVYLPVEAEVLDAVKTTGSRGPNHPGSTDNPKDHGEPRDDSDD